LDHHVPSKGTITLDILRVAAANGATREGSIFMNHGGPGGAGRSRTLDYAEVFRLAKEEDSVTRGQHYLDKHFDLVAVEPRGVGPSSAFFCRSEQLLPTYRDVTSYRDEANLARAENAQRVIAEGCLAQPQVRYINTEQTALDMELVRSALGDEKLNYFGTSYGTTLGSWYGRLFPERLGRMVLDSNMNWTKSPGETWLSQPAARQRSFEQLLAPYVAARSDIYALGEGSKAIIRDTHALSPGVLAASRGFFVVHNTRFIEENAAALLAAHVIDRYLRSDPNLTLDALRGQIEEHTFSRDSEIDELSREFADFYAEALFTEPAPETPLLLSPFSATYAAVSCNDAPSLSQQPSVWRALGDKYAVKHPVGGSEPTMRPCMYWGVSNVAAPPLERLTRGEGIVMVQAEFDNQTPEEGAFRTWSKVPNASMIYAPGEAKHTVFVGTNRCVDKHVSDFFAFGIRPGRLETCHQDQSTGSMHNAPGGAMTSGYRDRTRAAEMIERVQRENDRDDTLFLDSPLKGPARRNQQITEQQAGHQRAQKGNKQ
jgi:pimeloyl-ACP methyl ester carboxylesterase